MYFWLKHGLLQTVPEYREAFNTYLQRQIRLREPRQLYEPMSYILGLGGKRLRPVLTLMVTDALDGDYNRALPAALALEVFHNFSLVHDDIMDAAPLRRGKATVHEKWDKNTGILSGDAMLIRSYQLFESYEPDLFKALLKLFSRTALQVCEGQQYDVDFENREEVSVPEYLEMIRCKTAVLLAACLKSGAMIAGAPRPVCQAAYDFGVQLGIAFQLQDDYLDAFGDPSDFGKQPGGDIIENKKTFLFLSTLDLCEESEARELEHLYSIKPSDPSEKVRRVKELFEISGGARKTREAISSYTDQAFEFLEQMNLSPNTTRQFRDFSHTLMTRVV